MLEFLLPMLGSGVLTGLASLGETDKERSAKENQLKIDKMISQLNIPNFTQADADRMIASIRENFKAASDVAAGRIGANVGEGLAASGAPQGQAASDYYIQALAPTIASGESEANKSALALFEQVLMDKSRRQQLIAELLKLRAGNTDQMAGMTEIQKFAAGAMSGMKIGSDLGGSVAQLEYASKYK